ncbi:hypothetical protein EDB92DRAFT_1812573 [Lactarius akahatsu]|uniref:Uncharacterized protein n=1 Tax=Lactarius akahatsu TaxID=416441 RepID=A0AAD4LQ88_9AGAM|nr:hypothetical protein EDB92DRAFT_1812573 [Lactarius akahatsu]
MATPGRLRNTSTGLHDLTLQEAYVLRPPFLDLPVYVRRSRPSSEDPQSSENGITTAPCVRPRATTTASSSAKREYCLHVHELRPSVGTASTMDPLDVGRDMSKGIMLLGEGALGNRFRCQHRMRRSESNAGSCSAQLPASNGTPPRSGNNGEYWARLVSDIPARQFSCDSRNSQLPATRQHDGRAEVKELQRIFHGYGCDSVRAIESESEEDDERGVAIPPRPEEIRLSVASTNPLNPAHYLMALSILRMANTNLPTGDSGLPQTQARPTLALFAYFRRAACSCQCSHYRPSGYERGECQSTSSRFQFQGDLVDDVS